MKRWLWVAPRLPQISHLFRLIVYRRWRVEGDYNFIADSLTWGTSDWAIAGEWKAK